MVQDYSRFKYQRLPQNQLGSRDEKAFKYKNKSYYQNLPGSVLYFIQGENRGEVKMGMSHTPENRIKNLQTSYPYKLRFALVITNANSYFEEFFRDTFIDIKLYGEWYKSDILDCKDRLDRLVPAYNKWLEEIRTDTPEGYKIFSFQTRAL